MKDFLKFNIGHVIILITWLVTVVWGYSELNTRVKTIETRIEQHTLALEGLKNDKNAESKEISNKLSLIDSRIAMQGNDIEWIKKNIK